MSNTVDRRREPAAAHGWEICKAAAFTASLALILEHLGFLSLLVKVSWLIVGNLASSGPLTTVAIGAGTPIVVTLTETDFSDRYGERNPLDRCVLSRDIAQVLAKQPRILAVDFDLSPLARPSDEERVCQQGLDQLLDREAKRLVLLAPFPAKSVALREVRHAWMAARCTAGHHFADGSLDQSLGMATDHRVGHTPALQARMAEQVQGELSDHVCRTALHADRADRNPWLNTEAAPENDSEAGHEAEAVPLNFPAVMARLAVLPFGGDTFKQLKDLSGNAVIFGGDWGRDDVLLTTVGSLPGVVIHGARWVSLEAPVHPPSRACGLALDFAIAVPFGFLVSAFWNLFAKAKERDGHGGGLGTLALALFLTVYVALIWLAFVMGERVFERWHVAIAPVLIAVSMLVDGFISGPVEKIAQMAEHTPKLKEAGNGNPGPRRLAMHSLTAMLSRLGRGLRGAVFWGVVVWGLLLAFQPTVASKLGSLLTHF